MIGRIDGIHMAGEEHLHRGVGAYREVQMVAVRLCTDGARGRDRLDRFGLDQPERSRQRREGGGERLGDLGQPDAIGGAAADRDPGLYVLEHWSGGGSWGTTASHLQW